MYFRAEFEKEVYGNDLEKALKQSAEEMGLTSTTKEKFIMIFSAEDGTHFSHYSGTDIKLWRGLIPMAYISGIECLKHQSNFSIQTGSDSPFPFYGFASNDMIDKYLINVRRILSLQEIEESRDPARV